MPALVTVVVPAAVQVPLKGPLSTGHIAVTTLPDTPVIPEI